MEEVMSFYLLCECRSSHSDFFEVIQHFLQKFSRKKSIMQIQPDYGKNSTCDTPYCAAIGKRTVSEERTRYNVENLKGYVNVNQPR